MIFWLIGGFSALFSLLYFSIKTTEARPQLKNVWVLVGFILFMLGMLTIVVNSVGIYYGFLAWIENMGKLGSFIFKLSMVFVGVAIVVLVRYDEDAYDEYFDGKKYKD